MERFEEINHTADAGIRVTAPSLETLFREAARGLRTLMLPENMPVPSADMSVSIAVSGESPAFLMREWLAELLYIQSRDHVFVVDAELEHVSETDLSAVVHCARINEDLRVRLTEIKAVTYHRLSVRRTREGFEARVIFDT